MGDISKKGRGRALLGGPLGGTGKRIKTYEEEVNAGPTESLGIYASGGHEGKPHSTKKGRIRAAVPADKGAVTKSTPLRT